MAKVRVNWGPVGEGSSVKLFSVCNTAHNSLYVLAQDRQEAMGIAYAANHIYFPQQKIAETYSRLADEIEAPFGPALTQHWTLIQAAIARGLRGTVHFEEDRIAIGDEAFSE
jgi:hypothetical protein